MSSVTVPSSQVKTLSLPNVTVGVNPATLDLGGPNLGTIWTIEFVVVTYKIAAVIGKKIGPFGSIEAAPVARLLQDGSMLLSEVQGKSVNSGINEEKQFGPLTANFQFPQSPQIPGGHTVTFQMEMAVVKVINGGKAECSQGNLSLGYTVT